MYKLRLIKLKKLVIKLEKSMLSYSHDPLSYECSAVVYFPEKHLFKKETYLFQLFGGNLRNINFDNIPEIEDFHYQNQSDEPEDVSSEEWMFRKDVWDTIFPTYDAPSDKGLIFEFISINDASSIALGVEGKFREYVNEKLKTQKQQ